jgi:hypothetical protein
VLLAVVDGLDRFEDARLVADVLCRAREGLDVLREAGPMRGSLPIPFRIISMSAPRRSAMFASSFMKLILVASIAFAAYLVSSADRRSMTIMRCRLRVNGS